MAGEWVTTMLGDVIELKRGYDLPTSRRLTGSVPIVSSGGVSGSHSESMVRGPGVVTGRYGTIGQVFYLDHDFWPLNTTLYVRDFKGANARFVAYFLTRLDFQAYTDKAAVPGINRNDLHRAEVLWPPREEQDRIAHLLGTIDDKIELNQRMAATLEEMARALFKSWFVDFDPVRAKVEGRPTGLPDATAALFPDNFGKDGLPEGWGTVRLGSLIELFYGKSLTADLRRDGQVPVFGSNGRVGLHDQALVDGPGIVVGRKGNPGTVTYAHKPFFPIDTTFYVAARQSVGVPYLYHLMKRARLEERSGDSAVPGLNREAAYSVEVIAPPDPVCSFFSETCDPLLVRMAAYQSECETLATLRDILLPKLISGELRIKDARATVVAA